MVRVEIGDGDGEGVDREGSGFVAALDLGGDDGWCSRWSPNDHSGVRSEGNGNSRIPAVDNFTV